MQNMYMTIAGMTYGIVPLRYARLLENDADSEYDGVLRIVISESE